MLQRQIKSPESSWELEMQKICGKIDSFQKFKIKSEKKKLSHRHKSLLRVKCEKAVCFDFDFLVSMPPCFWNARNWWLQFAGGYKAPVADILFNYHVCFTLHKEIPTEFSLIKKATSWVASVLSKNLTFWRKGIFFEKLLKGEFLFEVLISLLLFKAQVLN